MILERVLNMKKILFIMTKPLKQIKQDFKFAHIADSHIGGWRDLRIRELTNLAFERAVDTCLNEGVDFVIIAGDLFNTALPGIDSMNLVTKKLFELKNAGVRVYAVPGSHDYSPSGKTFLSTLEKAGLLVNLARAEFNEETQKLVLKPTVDEETGTILFGMIGRRNSLEKNYFEVLDYESINKDIKKHRSNFQDSLSIFVFHSAISELNPSDLYKLESISVNQLPKNFDYYAAGHVHVVINEKIGDKLIVYPGPLFPNNFSELEKLKSGGFFIVSVSNGNIVSVDYKQVRVKNVFSISINADNKTPSQVTSEILDVISDKEFYDTIVLLRVEGLLSSGKPSDVDFKRIIDLLYERGAFFVMKNTYNLKSPDFEGVKVVVSNTEDVENKIIDENVKGVFGLNKDETKEFVKQLMGLLSKEQVDGETKRTFELRLNSEFDTLLEKLFTDVVDESSNN